MIEIRTFQGSAHSVALAIQNAETQANTYLCEQGYVHDVKTHAQTLPDLDGDMNWYLHIITLTITTQGPQPALQPAFDFSQATAKP